MKTTGKMLKVSKIRTKMYIPEEEIDDSKRVSGTGKIS